MKNSHSAISGTNKSHQATAEGISGLEDAIFFDPIKHLEDRKADRKANKIIQTFTPCPLKI